MRSQQLCLLSQPRVHARTAAIHVQEQNQRKIGAMVICTLASAIIVLWIAYLPDLIGSVLTSLNIMPTHLSAASHNVNRANKDDQLVSGGRFDDRWNALATMTIRTLGEAGTDTMTKDTQRIPVGCEPAFSYLVKTGNFSARCVARADISTRLAQAE